MAYIYVPTHSTLPENWGTGGGGGGGGSDNYNDLTNKPKINDVEVSGNKTAEQLKLAGLKAVQAMSTMPSTATLGTTVMYTGESGVYEPNAIYRFDGTTWNKIAGAGEVASIEESKIKELFEE